MVSNQHARGKYWFRGLWIYRTTKAVLSRFVHRRAIEGRISETMTIVIVHSLLIEPGMRPYTPVFSLNPPRYPAHVAR